VLIRPWTAAECSGPVWVQCGRPYRGTGTADQADLVKLGSAQLNLMSLHFTLVWQLPVIDHKIDRHGGHSWKRQRPLDKPRNDDDDDDDDDVDSASARGPAQYSSVSSDHAFYRMHDLKSI